jgi:hypothetical protein
MAKAQLRGDFPTLPGDDTGREAAALVAEIARRYAALQALSYRDQPCAGNNTGRTLRGSLAYQALETQIRALAARHWRLTSGVPITETRLSPQWGRSPQVRGAASRVPDRGRAEGEPPGELGSTTRSVECS